MQANPAMALEVARELLAAGGPAALASLAEDGGPFASYVLAMPDRDGSPILLLSGLAVHTANLRRDARASLLFVRDAGDGAAAAAQRLSLVGRVGDHPDQDAALRTFVQGHPQSGGYARFGDFRFFRFEIRWAHLVAGFGLIASLSGDDLLSTRGEDG